VQTPPGDDLGGKSFEMWGMEGYWYSQRGRSKGVTAKIVQSNGLREGLGAEIMAFARECADFPGRTRVITVFLWALAGSGPVRAGALDTTLGGVWASFNYTRDVNRVYTNNGNYYTLQLCPI
jgi:hypothetical protein